MLLVPGASHNLSAFGRVATRYLGVSVRKYHQHSEFKLGSGVPDRVSRAETSQPRCRAGAGDLSYSR